jgi:hypothetical protein
MNSLEITDSTKVRLWRKVVCRNNHRYDEMFSLCDMTLANAKKELRLFAEQEARFSGFLRNEFSADGLKVEHFFDPDKGDQKYGFEYKATFIQLPVPFTDKHGNTSQVLLNTKPEM